jgi:hypothetical protein
MTAVVRLVIKWIPLRRSDQTKALIQPYLIKKNNNNRISLGSKAEKDSLNKGHRRNKEICAY